jgi:5-oxoprolinase (ATP-hydrolysing) subunit A
VRQSIDLNADMGEGYGAWPMGNDAALMKVISSANIACGFHAGDPTVMAKTMDLALRTGVALGAHPGFADLQGFGRRRMQLSASEITALIQYQLGAASAIAQGLGAKLDHFKLHGALSNMAAESDELARACFQAALAVQPDIRLVIMPQTAMEAAAHALDASCLNEVFADRSYDEAGRLMDRSLPGAVLHDPTTAAVRIENMLRDGCIISHSGKKIAARIDTVCVHGDSESAVQLAQCLRERLQKAGIVITRSHL